MSISQDGDLKILNILKDYKFLVIDLNELVAHYFIYIIQEV